MQSSPSNIVSIVAPVVVIGIILVVRMRRMTSQRPLKLATLWIIPALFLVIAGLTLWQFPPRGLDWLWLTVSLALGVVLGWQRGRLMKIWVEPESGKLMTQGSGWAIIFLVVLIVLRVALRTGLVMEADASGISPAMINGLFVVFALGLFGTQRAEMALRAVRLGKAHSAGGGVADGS
jgi:membrane protein CcdC involved in cytochrome C biogenesis